ncbi:MAG TPA: phospholipase C, phosphocholine-specific, partial [Gemmatimonadaceae bacterium]|nr:phospholipase C, phosphocholine-specific [Gemmatimonadaceae bacterium]
RDAALLAGGAITAGSIPDAIARAMAIDPPPGTTFHDAEHVVILMQENRSFDHAYGALRGVRGFRDPRAHVLPNGNPVWFQSDALGETYAPFRLDITATNATWIGGLPHSWTDQVDARNGGRYDKWLIAKPKRDLPFTLGHYARADIPFYYSLADAFTVCDQAFCSSLTGTTANRLFLWSGAIRANAADVPRVLNEETDYDREVNWRTFPERLEDAGVSWRIYQNEVSIDSGLQGDEDAWLSGFGDNPIEWFSQFNIRFAKSRRAYLPKFLAEAPARIRAKEAALLAPDLTAAARKKLDTELAHLRAELKAAESERVAYTGAAWTALSARAKALHEKAFTTNTGDPSYRSLTTLAYDDGATRRETHVPAGDVLHQFRQDVATGALPAVSWLVAPQNFSDHPSAPWYGAWYVSEVLDILTKNPDVWKKTVFILCYDENDGYFDHVPPFVAPHPSRPETGKVSAGMDTASEWATVHGRDSSIGLGYRVPLVIASPWSRGGCVNSQVFDHTSILRFLEVWTAGKGKSVKETNISDWRRTVCGDLTSAFRPYDGERIALPSSLDRDATVERLHAAKFRQPPRGGAALTKQEVAAASVRPLQEPGTRPSCPLPYELVVNAEVRDAALAVAMEARVGSDRAAAQGSPFSLYSYGADLVCRSYAVRAGDVVHDSLPLGDKYLVRVDGPNGFMREFSGVPGTRVTILVDQATGNTSGGGLIIRLTNRDTSAHDVSIRDVSYGAPVRHVMLQGGAALSVPINVAATHGWYDFTVMAASMTYRYAGRVETGGWGVTDPAMG